MRRLLLSLGTAMSLLAQGLVPLEVDAEKRLPFKRVETSIRRHLGRPYVWGASGLKGFDCSGFVWRVFWDAGYLVKRTTARKMFLSLQEPGEGLERLPGNLVFFDDLAHVGIVENETHFYHSGTSLGTSRAAFGEHWEHMITGYRTVEGVSWAPKKKKITNGASSLKKQ